MGKENYMRYSEEDYLEKFEVLDSQIKYGMKAMTLHYAISKVFRENMAPFESTKDYWSFEQYNLVTLSILNLGRIFDDSNDVYGIFNFSNALGSNIEAFNFENLKIRKKNNFDDEKFKKYIEGKSEFNKSDYKIIKKKLEKLKIEFNTDYKDLRNKIIAHREVFKFSELNNKKYKLVRLFEIYIELYNIFRDLKERYHNGREYELLNLEDIENLVESVKIGSDISKRNLSYFKRIIQDFILIYNGLN
jgi:hypothetical protein